MSRKISYQVRHIVTLPDDFPEDDEPTNTTVEFITSDVLMKELTTIADGIPALARAGISVSSTSERLDK